MLGDLLDQGVKVALVYGDSDYQCNCKSHLQVLPWQGAPANMGMAKGYGGEQVSLVIESQFTQGFQDAGYAEIQTNATYVGGLVRQHGNLSFSRVFDAGHDGESAAHLAYAGPSWKHLTVLSVQSLGTSPKQHIRSSKEPCSTRTLQRARHPQQILVEENTRRAAQTTCSMSRMPSLPTLCQNVICGPFS